MFFKKKKEEKLDDDSWLDDGDISFDDEGGFDSDLDMDSRNPISQVTGNFVDGMKESAKSSHNHRRIIKDALPSSYTYAFDAQQTVRDEIKTGYGELKDEAGKQVDNFKKSNARVINKLGDMMPGKTGKKIKDWGERTSGAPIPEADYEALGVAAQINDIFGAQASLQAQERATETAIEGNTEARQQTQIALNSNEALVGVNNNLGRLVEYQDNVGSKYQRKMIELTFRQLYVSRKALNVQEKHSAYAEAAYDVISKNTALPDSQKVRDMELAGFIAKEKFLGNVTNEFSDTMANFAGKIGKRVTKKGKDLISTFGSTFSSTAGDFGNAIMGDENGEGGLSLMELATMELGGMASSMVAERLLKQSSGWLKGQADSPEYQAQVKKGATILDIARAGGGRYANENILGGTTGNSFIDGVSGFFGLSQDRVKHNNKVAGSYVDSMADVTEFDNQTHRSINEIIPDLLAKIHFETRRFNGDEPEGPLTYDWRLNQFSTTDKINKRLAEDIYDSNNLENLDSAQRSILSSLDPNNELSIDARDAIVKLAAVTSMTNRSVSLTAVIDPNSEYYNKEIAEHVDKRLGTRVGAGDDVTNPIEFATKSASQEFLDAEFAFQQGINDSKAGIKDPLNDLIAHAKQGRVSDLTKLDFIEQDENGNITTNMSKYYDYLRKQEADKASKNAGKIDDDWLSDYIGGNPDDPTGGGSGGKNRLGTWLSRAGIAGAGMGASALASAATVGGDLALNGLSMADGSTLSLVVGGTLAGSMVASTLFGKIAGNSADGSGFSGRASANDSVFDAGAQDATVQLLEKIHGTMLERDYSGIGQQVAMLSDQVGVIAANMPTGGGVDLDIVNTLGTGQRAVLGAYNTAKGFGKGAYNTVGPLLKGYYKGLGKGAIKLKDGAVGTFKWGKNTVGGLRDGGVNAIYVKGQAVASLTARGIKDQEYIDAGTGNVIKSLADVQGAVTNRDGSVTFITQEQFETAGVEDRPASAFSVVKGAGTGILNVMSKPYTVAGKAFMSAYNKLDGFSFTSGIYIEGESSPRLDLLSLKRGYYRLASNGKVVKSMRDLKGDIIDRHGNVVLTLDQITTGLFDKTGKKIDLTFSNLKEGAGTLADKAWGATKAIGSFGGDVLGSIGRFGVDMFKGAKEKLAKWREDKEFGNLFSFGLFTNGSKQLEEIQTIRKILVGKFGSGETKYNDTDGDGDRDGSYKDIKQNRAKEKDMSLTERFMHLFNKKGGPDKNDTKKDGFFATMMGGLGSIITGVIGTALKVGLPAIVGTLGLKSIAKYLLNRDKEVISPDDPRLDPNSPDYDPDLVPGVQNGGFGNKAANWFLDQGLATQLAAGYGAFKAPGLLLKGAGKVAGMLGARNAAAGGRAGLLGAGSQVFKGAGKLALGLGKFGLRFAGPIGWAWTAYEVTKWGLAKIESAKMKEDPLLRLRMAAYGYEVSNKEKTAFFLGLENQLKDFVNTDGKEAYITDEISAEDVMSTFGINPTDVKAVTQWREYFYKRFLPTFLTFATVMHAKTESFDIASMDTKLDPEQKLSMCDMSIFAREENNPYNIMSSGFLSEESVEMNHDDVMEIYKLVRVALEVKHNETKGSYISKQDAKDEKSIKLREKQLENMKKEKEKKAKDLGTRLNKWVADGAVSLLGDKLGGIIGGLAMGNLSEGETTAFSMANDAGGKIKDWITGLFSSDSSGSGGISSPIGSPPTASGKPGAGFTAEVANAIKWGAGELGIDPNHLASVISFETGGKFGTNVRNPKSSATGLIQFMDGADGKSDKLYWGMTRDQFGSLSIDEQMKYVVKFFRGKKLKPGAGIGDVYDAVTGTGYRKGTSSYELNKVWDANKDGYVAPGESVTSGAFKDHMKDFFGGSQARPNSGTPLKGGTPYTSPSIKLKMGGIGTGGNSPIPYKASSGTTDGFIAKTATTDSKAAVTGTGAQTPTSASGTSLPADSKPAKAAAFIARNALGSSSGYCARFVKNGLIHAGYDFTSQASAYMYSTNSQMANMGFVQIAGNTSWQEGDVMVFNKNSQKPHGHIQMFTSVGWTSDFKQRSWKPYSTNCPPFQLWRDANYLAGATTATGWVDSVSGNVGYVDSQGSRMVGAGAGEPGKVWQRKGGKILSSKELNEGKKRPRGSSASTPITAAKGTVAKEAKVDKEVVAKNKADNALANIESTPSSKLVDANHSKAQVDKELEVKAKNAQVERERRATVERKARAETADSRFGETNDILNRQLKVQQQMNEALTFISKDIRLLASRSGGVAQPQTVSAAEQAMAQNAVKPAIAQLKEPVSLLKG